MEIDLKMAALTFSTRKYLGKHLQSYLQTITFERSSWKSESSMRGNEVHVDDW